MRRTHGQAAKRALQRALCLMAVALATAGCATSTSPSVAAAPADRFLAALAAYCGQAFAGRVRAGRIDLSMTHSRGLACAICAVEELDDPDAAPPGGEGVAGGD